MNDQELRRDLRAFAASAGPSSEQREKIRARLARARPREGRRWQVAIGLGGLAAAAAVAAALIHNGSAERAIEPKGQWEQLADDIAIYSMGRGIWSNGFVRWNEGELRLSVVPDQGVELRILTPEAVIEVVGTVFTVERDEFGTSVQVARGRVSVACTSEAERLLGPGEHSVCFRSIEAGLGHVLKLEAEGKSPEVWLGEIERALEHPYGTEEARSALRAMQIDALLSTGQLDDAAALTQAWLSSPTADLAAVSAVARALLARDGCGPAVPFLEHLSARGDGIAAVWLADCVDDPREQRRILEAARGDIRPEVQQAIDARIGAIGER